MNHFHRTTRSVITAFAALLFLILSSFAFPAGSNWNIPGGTKANFTIDGMMGIDVNGTLTISNAAIVFDPANPQSGSMNVVLNVSSIATGIGKRDKHLKTDDFFDVTKYPSISFKSSAIQKDGSNYKVTGTLKIKDVSKTITIPFSFNENGNNGTFKGSFTIDRASYHIGTGKENAVGDEVKINLNIPVKKAA